jgi:hypothetical protein
MRRRIFLLPTGTWTLLTTADPTLLSDGTILIDPYEPNPGKRMRVLRHHTWGALTETDLEHLTQHTDTPA